VTASAEGLQQALGRNVRDRRRALAMTQEQFALHLGVHRTYLSSLERGAANLTLKSVERLAGKLEVEPRELLRDSER
jgi:transcriptional regulator with XRE-family HTH domain